MACGAAPHVDILSGGRAWNFAGALQASEAEPAPAPSASPAVGPPGPELKKPATEDAAVSTPPLHEPKLQDPAEEPAEDAVEEPIKGPQSSGDASVFAVPPSSRQPAMTTDGISIKVNILDGDFLNVFTCLPSAEIGGLLPIVAINIGCEVSPTDLVLIKDGSRLPLERSWHDMNLRPGAVAKVEVCTRVEWELRVPGDELAPEASSAASVSVSGASAASVSASGTSDRSGTNPAKECPHQ